LAELTGLPDEFRVAREVEEAIKITLMTKYECFKIAVG
jgi:hypothetical protein